MPRSKTRRTLAAWRQDPGAIIALDKLAERYGLSRTAALEAIVLDESLKRGLISSFEAISIKADATKGRKKGKNLPKFKCPKCGHCVY